MAAALKPAELRITFVGHAAFRIDTPGGASAVTDFFGDWVEGAAPDVVTINRAHSTHWTANSDPRIPHVLTGWDDANPEGADHWRQVGDMLVRTVPTDIRGWRGLAVNGNSIVVFEKALCTGHVDHLHHLPTDAQHASLGRVDGLMVPVDGGYTMNQEAMAEVVRRVRASMVLPMHWFGPANLQTFLAEMAGDVAIAETGGDSVTVSLSTLPDRPTVLLLRPR